MPIGFFNPTSPITVPTTWILQSNGPSTSKTRAQGLKSNGDEAASHLYAGQTSDTLTFKVFSTSGNIVPATLKAGSVVSGYHVDSVSVAYTPTDWPTVTLSIHKHDDLAVSSSTSHGGQSNKYTSSLNLPAGWGCPSGLRSLLFETDDASVGISSFNYSCGVTHQDEVGDNGNWLASEDRDGNETINVSFVGIPTSAPAIDGWDCTSNSRSMGNTSADTSSFTFEHHLQRDTDEEED